MNKILKSLLILLAVLIIGGFIGWQVFLNIPKATVKEKAVDITISADNLYKEYSANEGAGDKKYISQVIQVKGKITDKYEDEQGASVVLLGLEGEDMGGVLCTFELSEKEKINQISIGEEVSVKGSCSGILMEVVLNRCVLIK